MLKRDDRWRTENLSRSFEQPSTHRDKLINPSVRKLHSNGIIHFIRRWFAQIAMCPLIMSSGIGNNACMATDVAVKPDRLRFYLSSRNRWWIFFKVEHGFSSCTVVKLPWWFLVEYSLVNFLMTLRSAWHAEEKQQGEKERNENRSIYLVAWNSYRKRNRILWAYKGKQKNAIFLYIWKKINRNLLALALIF